MKASIELSLRTREVHQLFKRRINGDKLFVEAILHKFNALTGLNQKNAPTAHNTYEQIEQAITHLTQQFNNEIASFEHILRNNKTLTEKKINFHEPFNCKIIVTNRLALHLVNFIETYDKLIATLQLLHLAGCFAADGDCYANVRRLQQAANQMLSKSLLARCLG